MRCRGVLSWLGGARFRPRTASVGPAKRVIASKQVHPRQLDRDIFSGLVSPPAHGGRAAAASARKVRPVVSDEIIWMLALRHVCRTV